MSGGRERVLADIRRSLGRSGPSREAIVPLPGTGPRPSFDGDIVERFVAKMLEKSATLVRITSVEQVGAEVARFVASVNAGKRLCVAQALDAIDWPAGFEVEHRAARRDDETSVTPCFAAVAESGGIVTLSGPATPSTLNFVPDNHIVIVHASQVVRDFEAVWTQWRASGRSLPRTVNIISGPSRTADIEMTIQLGAHGPRRLHILLVAAWSGLEATRCALLVRVNKGDGSSDRLTWIKPQASLARNDHRHSGQARCDDRSISHAPKSCPMLASTTGVEKMVWQQVYDPFGNMIVSTALAAVPVVVMLVGLGFLHLKAHLAAAAGLIAAIVIAVFAYGMPAGMAGNAALLGGLTGLLPIGWIVLNIIFLQQLAEQSGGFKILQDSLSGITEDRRLQLLLIAFCFGAFFEGAAGFGTPVAVTAGILIGLGFSPLAASGLSLIANTAPVAFGALGTPVITLAKVHGYDLMEVTAMIGRQLPFFSLLVPFWLIWAFAGRKAMMEIWPAILVTGLSFAIPQFLVSNYIGPELVDIIAAIVSMVSLIAFLRVWQPKTIWTSPTLKGHENDGGAPKPVTAIATHSRAELIRAWTPWAILTVFVFVWGLPPVKAYLNGLFAPAFPIAGLHNLVEKVAPVVPKPTKESAVYVFGLLSATGTGILLAAIIGGLLAKFSIGQLLATYGRTIWLVKFSLLTIVLMLGLGTLTRYSGTDTTLGLAFANTGVFYPFFGTLMGWIGVAMTGSDTASNVLFGGMQRVAAEQLGLSPNLMGAANSSGGVMGKMIDAQSIVVASTATRWFDHEGDILRYVFFHSIALACLVGLFVTLQAYVWPFTLMVVH